MQLPDGQYAMRSFFVEDGEKGIGTFQVLVKDGIPSLLSEDDQSPVGLLDPKLLQKVEGNPEIDLFYQGTLSFDER